MSHGRMLKTLELFYQAEGAYLRAGGGDFTAIASTLASECVLYQPPSLPYGGEWRGHRGFEKWMQSFSLTWAAMEVTKPEQMPIGDVVISRSHVHAERRGTGEKFDWPLLQYFKFREGLISELWPFYWDTATLVDQLQRGKHA